MKASFRATPSTLAKRLLESAQYSEIKRLADTIMALQHERAFRSLAILSLLPGEGKTLFTASLATAYSSASPSRVLVIDTASKYNDQSLVLKQCMGLGQSAIDFLSLEDYRRGTNGNGNSYGEGYGNGKSPASGNGHAVAATLEPDMVANGTTTLTMRKKSDQALIQAVSRERADQYGLMLLDTVPLNSKNKNNIDPLLVARMADASLLIVSPILLNSSALESHLKILRDPSLHLMGIISNEEFFK
jgi:Mrp family chromosome partitioning ATPase